MMLRIQTVLSLLAVGFVLVARADEPAKNRIGPAASSAAFDKDALTLKKEIDARKFREFQQALLALAHKYERSHKPGDRDKAANIRKALETASAAGVDTRFDRLIGLLKTSQDLNYQEVKEAMELNRMLVQDIRAIIAQLTSGNRDEELKKLIQDLQRIRDIVDQAERNEQHNRAAGEAGRSKDERIEREKKNIDLVRGLERPADRDGRQENRESKPKSDGRGENQDRGEKKDGGQDKPDGTPSKSEKKDEGKSDAGSGKSQPKSDGQDGGQKSDNKPNSDQERNPQPGKQALPADIQKQIEAARKEMEDAQKRIQKDQDATKPQTRAIEELARAKKKLEELLRQLREEEIERILAGLQLHCEKMRQMQMEVLADTLQVHRGMEENPKKNPEANRNLRMKAVGELSPKEGKIVEEATKVIQILEAEGSAVAFPEVFIQLREDMRTVERRLGQADAGTMTQAIEKDIIKILEEMIAALKEAIKKNKEQANQPPPPGTPSQGKPEAKKLIEALAELKMIKAMQTRVNQRTETYGKQYQGEQASAPAIQKELTDLAQRQQKIFEITRNIAMGKNQ